jgi:hypothetical protein
MGFGTRLKFGFLDVAQIILTIKKKAKNPIPTFLGMFN